MKYMTPYETPFYFILIAILVLPIIWQLMAKGKRILWYQTLITFFFLLVSFGGVNLRQGIALVIYVIWELTLTWLYFRYRQKKNQSFVFYGAVFLAILPLIFVKVTPLVSEHPSLFGFLGISYLTFKVVQMIMEMRDGILKEFHWDRYLQFLLFFPTISSGPIDRYRRFEKDLLNPPDREKYTEMIDKGIQKIFIGFLYKYILSYLLSSQLIPHIMKDLHNSLTLSLVEYMYVYSLYLFFDFAGYSYFAVGTSYLLGYETPDNFNKPFISANIKEFWNRWHMSLSFWFRDYVYMRLMFTLIKKKVFKSRIVASNIGYFALFLIMGVWHGLTWYYIVYGLYHATLICLNDAWIRFKKRHPNLPSNLFTRCLSTVVTFHAVCFSFLIFSGILDQVIRTFNII